MSGSQPVKLPLAPMINKSTTNNSSPPPSHELWAGTDHLDSWKEIATYLRREIRTVQLWEKKEGLPIHRHFHKQLGSVYALRSELERWKRQVSRTSSSPEIEPGDVSKRIENRITICVPPLTDIIVSSQTRQVCDSIVAKT